MSRVMYCIGGGELKDHTTIKLDEYLVNKAKAHAGEKRACALFIPTASHDFMPYYNTFHRVYTGIFDIKTEVAMTVFHPYDEENLKKKFLKSDLIYIGGGDTLFMIDSWKQTGLIDLIMDAYNRGVIIAGLSAGAIFAFEKIYTDSKQNNEDNVPYDMGDGLGIIKGVVSPHYNHRVKDFDNMIIKNKYDNALGIEDNAMIEIIDEKITQSISSNGNHVYAIHNNQGILTKEVLLPEVTL